MSSDDMEPIPDDLRRFVLTSVPSVPYIESLLLIRSECDAAWTAAQLAGRVYVPVAQATRLLEALEASGIASREPGTQVTWRYRPKPELVDLLTRLATLYPKNLLTITGLIHSSVNRRANQFADAFRWKKDN